MTVPLEPDAEAASFQDESVDNDEFFGPQRSTRSQLPDPVEILEHLSRGVIEVLTGARDLDQMARWVTDDLYAHLLKRSVLAARARAATGRKPYRPAIVVGRINISEPRDGVIEAVVMIHGLKRVGVVAVRLEGMDHRWRASAISVL